MAQMRTSKEEYQWEQTRTGTRRRRGQDSDVTGSSSPQKPGFDAVPKTYGGISMVPNSRSKSRAFDLEPSRQNGSWNKVRPKSSRPVGGIGGGSAEYGIGKDQSGNRAGDEFEGYAEYGQYMNDMEQMFGHGGNGEVKLSLTQLGHGHQGSEDRQIGNGSGKPAGPRSNAAMIKVGTGRIGRPSRLRSVGRSGEGGPKAGQDYEMVNKKVVEDGPEKTVTISTWREQVANETRTVQEGELDVYYVGAEDYPDENGVRGHEVRTETDSHINRWRTITPSETRKGSGSGGPSSSGGKTKAEGRRPSTEVRYSPLQALDRGEKTDALTKVHASVDKTSGHTYHSQSRSEEIIRSENYFPNRSILPRSESWKQESLPRPDTTPEKEDSSSVQSHESPLVGSMNELRSTPPQSSTPLRWLPEFPPPEIPTPPRASTPYRTMTPRDRELSQEPDPDPEPFHPTQSGSTISTIKSGSMVAFENVLASCEPSLLHILPVLSNLGIVTEGHLRAVARLTEETRDREVKDEALRQGVTVMEWAILLDKLQAL